MRGRPGPVPFATVLFAACLVATFSGASDAVPPDEPALRETVTVVATRLPGPEEPADRVPAQITVIEREQIERSGVRTLQDLLALEAGVVVYDEVGNDVEKTFDLRGFSQGSGTRVFLDGAPINDTRNNSLALDMIPLEAIERIEISRGSAAALAGGGSEAGVIHLLTRRGTGLGGAVSASGGTFDTTNLAAEAHGGFERFDFFVSGTDMDTDGFRRNAGGDVRRLAGTLGTDFAGGRRLSLSVVDSRSDLGNPGALTAAELAADRAAAPFNGLDYSNEDLTQAALDFRGALAGGWSVSANVFARDGAGELLSTGRSASLFGGFLLDSEASALGSTLQVTHEHRAAGGSNRLVAGAEWLDGETDALGYFTSPADLAAYDPDAPASSNTTERRTQALYLQDQWSPAADWTLMLGVRRDSDRVEYRDRLDPTLSDARRFSEVSLKAGAHWQAAVRHGLYVSYGEGFLPPTAEELFSFPLFFSNPKLQPEDSRSWEVGYRGRFGERAQLDLSLFRIDTDDEIVFVPDPPPLFTGANRNVGNTRRRGVEAALHGRAGRRVGWFANLTLVDAEFREGPAAGDEVPLVPRERLAAGVDLDLPAALSLRLDALAVAEQVVDNDPGDGTVAKLDGYEVVNARLTWAVTGRRAPVVGGKGLRLWLDARNLLDQGYSSRAIWAGETFFTPAPGRRWALGATWSF